MPINWYSVSTTSCFAWQVKPTWLDKTLAAEILLCQPAAILTPIIQMSSDQLLLNAAFEVTAPHLLTETSNAVLWRLWTMYKQNIFLWDEAGCSVWLRQHVWGMQGHLSRDLVPKFLHAQRSLQHPLLRGASLLHRPSLWRWEAAHKIPERAGIGSGGSIFYRAVMVLPWCCRSQDQLPHSALSQSGLGCNLVWKI